MVMGLVAIFLGRNGDHGCQPQPHKGFSDGFARNRHHDDDDRYCCGGRSMNETDR